MAEMQESKSERLTLAISPTEMEAVEFVHRIHHGRFDGVSSVLRDYSITQCLDVYRLALAKVSSSATVA